MANRLVIVGAGYVGKRLAERAVEEGCEVVGTTRSAETLGQLEQAGAIGVEWDVLDDPIDAIGGYLAAGTAVVYSVPTLFGDYEAANVGLARHVEPVDRVMAASVEGGADQFVYLSSTSVFGDHQGRWVDENTPCRPTSPVGRMRRDIEEYVVGRRADLTVNVARLVGIYGPGRTLMNYLKSGRYTLVDGGAKPTNRIHVDDILSAVLAIVERAPSGARVYNICDGRPHTAAELVDFLVDHCGIDRPPAMSLQTYAEQRGPNAVARWKNTYRCKRDRLVDELGVDLAYPDVLAGYRAILGID